MWARWVGICTLTLLACQRDEPVFVMNIFPGDLPQGTSNIAVGRSVEEALKMNSFILAEGSKRNYVAKVDVRRESAGFGTNSDRWVMAVVLAPRDTSDLTQIALEGIGETPAEEATPNDQQLAAAAKEACAELSRERALIRKPASALEAALTDDSRPVRDYTIRLAGARRLKELVPVLSQRLTEEPEPDLVLRIVGSLVQIGDSRAVGPLVELTKRKHPIFINQIVYALAAIGGSEAEAYLDTLAQGHPSDQVRAAAKEALGELLSKKSAKLKPQAGTTSR